MEIDMLIEGQQMEILVELKIHINPTGHYLDDIIFRIERRDELEARVQSSQSIPTIAYNDLILNGFNNFDDSDNNIDSVLLDNHLNEIQSMYLDQIEQSRITQNNQSRQANPSHIFDHIDEIDQNSLGYLNDLLIRIDQFEFELYLTTLDRNAVVF